MTFKKSLQHYYNKRIDAIISALKNDEEYFTEESFHHIRVEIKKLHAFFELLEASVKKFKAKKYFGPFKKLFTQIGTIREYQLEQAYLKKQQKQTPVTAYISYLMTKIKEETELFLTMKEKERKKIKNYGSKAFAYIDLIKKKKAASFLKKKGIEIESIILEPGIEISTIHDLRKQLKSYGYLLKCMEEPEEINHEKLDEFQDLLGKWHDNRVMSDHFNKVHLGNHFSKITRVNLGKISKKLHLASERQRKQIGSFVYELVASA